MILITFTAIPVADVNLTLTPPRACCVSYSPDDVADGTVGYYVRWNVVRETTASTVQDLPLAFILEARHQVNGKMSDWRQYMESWLC